MNNTSYKILFPNEFPSLMNERIRLRKYKSGDENTLFEIRSNPEIMKLIGSPVMESIDDAYKRINSCEDLYNNQKGIEWVIADIDSNQMLGYFCLWEIDYKNHNVSIGYALHPDFQKLGYMASAFELALSFAFNTMNFNRLEANIDVNNSNSEKVLKKFKFRKEAHYKKNYFFKGKHIDSIIYGLLKEEYLK